MRALLHETVTGKLAKELIWSSASWSTGVCRPDTVSVELPGYIGQDIYPYLIPHKYTVTLVEDDRRVRAAGVLGKPRTRTSDEGLHYALFPGNGIESIFSRRSVLPPTYWPLIDSAGYPIPVRDTVLSGVEYGTMMKLLYLQAMSHPGGDLPVALEHTRVGTRQKSWSAVDGKPVQDAIREISELIGGVEWDWVPRIDDNDNLTWALITGTDSVQEITSAFWHTWQTGGKTPDIRGLEVEVSPEFMTQTAIFTGGKEDDRVLVARSTGTDLISQGIPLSEVWDSSHSSVSDQATLNGWASKRRSEGQAPVQYWSFDVRADRSPGLRHGDWCTVEVAGHWIIPDGSYTRRILEVSKNSNSSWYGVTVAGEMSW